MADRILCAVKDHLSLFEDNRNRVIKSGFIEQYRSNHEQVIRKQAWRHEGEGARFRHDFAPHSNAQLEQVLDNAQITGIAPIDGTTVLYSVAIGDASGIFRRQLGDSNGEGEGHVLHDRGILLEGITVRNDGKVALAVRDRNGDWHIATSSIGSPHYSEMTEGNSVDRNPAWDPTNADLLYYDSAGVGTDRRGRYVPGPRAILRLHLAGKEIEDVLFDDEHDYICPQIDHEGNLWCIRKPYAQSKTPLITLRDILLLPAKIGTAIFRAIEFFTWRHTGETLTTAGPNPAKMREAPKDFVLEDVRIDTDRSLRENRKAGDTLPGIIPRKWELIRQNRENEITTVARGVCCFSLTSHGEAIYSNGRYIFRRSNDKTEKLCEEELPKKILLLPD
jgi:hypothetical protein